MPAPKIKVRKKPTNKRCDKGFPCKTTCISRAKNCKEPLRGQARTFALWEKAQQERLALTNKKRERAGLTPARLNDSKYITAERTKLPQSATAKITEKVSDAAIADDKGKGLELRNLALNGKITRNEFVSRWLKESVSPGELKPSKQSLNEKWFARIEKAFVNGKPISQEIINSMTPQQRQYFQILQKRRDESISKKQSGELSLDAIAQPKEKALFNTTKGLIEKYDRIAEEISSIEEDIAIRHNKGKSLLSNSNATIYSRQYVINSSTGKDGSSNTLGEFVILPKSKVDQQRKELLKKTKDESFKKEALSYWKEADLAVAKKLQESESLMKEIRKNIKSLPNDYVANLIASDLTRRGKQSSIYHDTPFIEGVSPFSDSRQLNRVLTENRSRIGLIAPPSPEVKPVPSSLQGSKNAIAPMRMGDKKDLYDQSREAQSTEQKQEAIRKGKAERELQSVIAKSNNLTTDEATTLRLLSVGDLRGGLLSPSLKGLNQKGLIEIAKDEQGKNVFQLTNKGRDLALADTLTQKRNAITEQQRTAIAPSTPVANLTTEKEYRDYQKTYKEQSKALADSLAKENSDRIYPLTGKEYGVEFFQSKENPKIAIAVKDGEAVSILQGAGMRLFEKKLKEKSDNFSISEYAMNEDAMRIAHSSALQKAPLSPVIEKHFPDAVSQYNWLTDKQSSVEPKSAIASSNLIPYSANENGVIVKNYPDDIPTDTFKKYIAEGDRKNIFGDTLSPRSVPAHQMRFEDYKEAWKNWTGSPGYTDDGINKSDLYYKKAIDKAIAEGKTIHPDVMKDYNNLDLSDYNTRKPKRSPAYEKAEREGTLSRLRPIEKTAKETEKAIASSKAENDIQSAIAPLEDLAKLRVDKSPKIASGVLLGSERVSEDVGDRYGDGTNAGRYIEYRVRRMPIEEARKYGYTGSGNIALERRPYDDSTTGRYWEGEWQPVHFASNTKELLDQQRGMLGRLESGHPYIKTIKENDRRSKEDEKAKKERDRQATETARVNYKDWMQTHVNQQYANSLPGKKITLHLDLVGEDDSTPTAPVPATRYGNMAVHKKYRYMDKDGTVHLGSTYSISDPSTGVVVVPSIPTLDQARRLTAVLYHEISDKNPIEWTVDERKKAGNVINAFLNGDRPSHITDNSTPVIREKKKARK